MVWMLILVVESALSCTCIDSDQAVAACERAQAKRSHLFVGEVVSVSSKPVSLPPDGHAFKMQVITFKVLQTFGHQKDSSVVLIDWPPGNGSCGYLFEVGKIYLVDTASGPDNNLQVASCGLTAHVDDAQDVLRFLRLRSHTDNAILFGTVREYIGERNFMSKQNKPLAGRTIHVEGIGVKRAIKTDKSGWFAISDLDPGTYAVRLDTGADYSPTRTHSIDIARGGCAQVDYRTDRVLQKH